MKQIFALIPMFFVILMTPSGYSQNPLIKNAGMSDPHARVFNDTLFLYTGHDDTPADKKWIMKDWKIYSTTNLMNWTLQGVVSPKENYMDDDSTDCWASDAATRNGKYYFYFSDKTRGIGVMTSDNPAGPFKDALGKALVKPMHDPTLLIDDDQNQTPYLIYGQKRDSYHIAKLNNDMISVAEIPKPIIITGEAWENTPAWQDKNYLFKHDGLYYLSWGQGYATSKNVYGPYQSVGHVGEGYGLGPYAHGSFFWWKGQFYHVWCYYIRKGFKYRETIISYCHFEDGGKIHTDTEFLDKHFADGVGRYDAAWPEIQAEWYYEISKGIKKQGNRADGFVLSGIKNGSWVNFPHVSFNKCPRKFSARALARGGNGTIEIRVDGISGPLLGVCSIQESGNAYQTATADLSEVIGQKNVFLVFRGDKGSTFNLDWIKFQ
jgi:arabinoxylan arabinofuranohydrolase